MADSSDMATKSPESDATELLVAADSSAQTQADTEEPAASNNPSVQTGAAESLIPGDTPAQTGASLGEHCTSDRPTPIGAAPSGEMSKLGDVDVYITKPADYPQSPSKLLLFLTGGTGVRSINNQVQADRFAEEGFLVVMPDMFENDPAPNLSAEDETNSSIIEQFKMAAAATAKSFMIDMWLARHTPEKILPVIHKVLNSAKEEFADAVANGDGIYGVGYCTGGRIILLLASEKADTVLWGQKQTDEEAGMAKKGPLIKAGAIAHASLVSQEDFNGVKAPLTIACVQNDALFPQIVLDTGEKYMKDNGVEHELKLYSGVPHGFAVVGEYNDTTIKTSQTKAFDQMLSWLKSH